MLAHVSRSEVTCSILISDGKSPGSILQNVVRKTERKITQARQTGRQASIDLINQHQAEVESLAISRNLAFHRLIPAEFWGLQAKTGARLGRSASIVSNKFAPLTQIS